MNVKANRKCQVHFRPYPQALVENMDVRDFNDSVKQALLGLRSIEDDHALQANIKALKDATLEAVNQEIGRTTNGPMEFTL